MEAAKQENVYIIALGSGRIASFIVFVFLSFRAVAIRPRRESLTFFAINCFDSIRSPRVFSLLLRTRVKLKRLQLMNARRAARNLNYLQIGCGQNKRRAVDQLYVRSTIVNVKRSTRYHDIHGCKLLLDRDRYFVH